MKHIIYSLTLAVLTVACGGGADDNGSPDFATVKADRTVSISQEQGAPQCQVHLSLAAAQNSPQAETINQTVIAELLNFEGTTNLQQAADSFAAKYTSEYQHNFALLYREDRNDPEKRAWYEYHYNITSDAQQGRKGVTVYTALIDYYEGGAHGINQKLTMNFDNSTGKMLTLDDIFVPGFETALNRLLLQKLMEETDTKDIDNLRDKGYLYSMDMFAPENFILDEDGITFIYNPYEIAPYEKGMTELTLDYNELKEIWKSSTDTSKN